ncbi:MAG: helix-turn-helix domain-containing protein [Clostridia bacterium]|nr:helix-turn-helix domain-containing protein [Clostridia bacterium]
MDLQTFLNDFMNKDDLDLLVRDASALFGCPAMVVDMAFNAVAWHAPEGFDDVPFRDSAKRGSLTYEAGSLLIGSTARARFVTLRDSPYRRRFSLLVTGGVPVGYLILVDVEDRLAREDLRVFSAVESALAKQLMLESNRGGSVQNTEESVLQHLLEGRFTDEGLFELQAEGAGLKYMAPRRVALANLELYRSTNWSENALRSTILDVFPMSKPLIHDGGVVFFLNSDPDMELFRHLAERFNLRVVISGPIGRLFDLPKVYGGAKELMEALLPLASGPFAVRMEDYQGLMMLRHMAERGDLMLPQVRALGERDRAEGSLYCLTLYTYLACHRSLQETCERLFTHRNTVLYRVRKLREEYDIPLDDPDMHLVVLLSSAMMLLEMGREDVFMPAPGAAGE